MSVVARALLITAATVAAWLLLVRYADRMSAKLAACRVAYVYDGDTVALDCGGPEEVAARLLGLDAPETKEPGCPEELAHGALATDRLRALVGRGAVTLRQFGEDKYGRPLIRLRIDGEDVADRLVREGLAVSYHGRARIDWCEKLRAA